MSSVNEKCQSDIVRGVQASRVEAKPLSDRENAILELEKSWWRVADTKDQAIRIKFGITPTRYYLMLNQLLDDPRAFNAEPQLIDRLRRLRRTRLDERR